MNPSKHPRAVPFCTLYLVRKLAEKGEETVASRPETAFQYASVVVGCARHVAVNFDTLLMAQLQEKCPYVVPYYPPRSVNQTDEQYCEYVLFNKPRKCHVFSKCHF